MLNLLDNEIAETQRLLADWEIAPNDFLVGIHPGGSSFDKRWPEENYAQVADTLATSIRCEDFDSQRSRRSRIRKKHPENCTIRIHCLRPEVNTRLAALIKRCDFFVCNDSGPMHIAAALDVRTVAIFGPTDYVAWKPLSEEATIVRRDMPCWPCSAHKCKIGWECTKKLTVDTVWDRVEEWARDKVDTIDRKR